MDYLTPALTFLGGGVVLAVVNYFINRRRAGVELGSLKDDQTVEWRNNALHLSDDIIAKDKQLMTALREANQHAIEKETLQHRLSRCLEKVENCKCD